MLAHAEDARDASELERRAQERGAHRLAVLVEVVAAHRFAGESHGADHAPRQPERGRDDASDPHRARRRHRPLRHDLELVADLQVAAHVDAVLVDVRQRPRELLARTGRKIVLGARVHRRVEIRRDRAANDDRVGRPRETLLDAGPCVATSPKVQ